MANSVDPDEMAHYKSSRPDLHGLHRNLFWPVGLKGSKEEKKTTLLLAGETIVKCIFASLLRSGLF